MKTNTETISHQLPSTIESIEMVEHIIDQHTQRGRIPEVLYGNCLIAATEAVSNAIKHGNALNQDKKVSLQFKFYKKVFCIEVEDEGSGFNYEKVPDPTAIENIEKLKGRGIFIMKNLCNDIIFDKKGSKVTLKFDY